MSPKMVSILLGAAVVAVLSSSYLSLINCLCCAGVIVGAMVAVWHYTGEHDITIESGEGAGMGAVSGAIGYLAAIIIDIPLNAIGLGSTRVQAAIYGLAEGLLPAEAIADAPADVGLAATILFAFVSLAIATAFGAAGGAIGAALFKKGTPPAAEPGPAQI